MKNYFNQFKKYFYSYKWNEQNLAKRNWSSMDFYSNFEMLQRMCVPQSWKLQLGNIFNEKRGHTNGGDM